MAYTPTKRVTRNTRHEWVVGDGVSAITARDLSDSIRHAVREMESMGLDITYDDAYHVRGADDGTVVIYVEVED